KMAGVGCYSRTFVYQNERHGFAEFAFLEIRVGRVQKEILFALDCRRWEQFSNVCQALSSTAGRSHVHHARATRAINGSSESPAALRQSPEGPGARMRRF